MAIRVQTARAVKLLRMAARGDGSMIRPAEARVALKELQHDPRRSLPVDRQPLTPRQRETQLAFHELARWSESPTVRDVAAKLGRSRSSVHDHLNALDEKGYLRRAAPNAARNYIVTRRGRDAVAAAKESQP